MGTDAPVVFVVCFEKPEFIPVLEANSVAPNLCGMPSHQSVVRCGEVEFKASNPEVKPAAAALWEWYCP